jgi:hypothetical protein
MKKLIVVISFLCILWLGTFAASRDRYDYGGSAADVNLSATTPLVLTGDNLSIPAASGSAAGYLTSAYWSIFNNAASRVDANQALWNNAVTRLDANQAAWDAAAARLLNSTVTNNTGLTIPLSAGTYIVNAASSKIITLPQAGSTDWSCQIIDGNNTAGADPNVKPYNGDNIVKCTGTALAANEGYLSTGDVYGKIKLVHYAFEPNVVREDANVGTWTGQAE